MAESRTAEAYYVERMGEELGPLFHALWQEVIQLRLQWGEYVELFGKKRTRVDLMNKAAPAFFRMIQDLLFEQTLLSIARLTDPPFTSGKENLTIQRLTGCINHDATAQEVARCTGDAVKAAEFCRDRRNRLIAHRDLPLAIGKQEKAGPLESASRNKVEAALSAIERAVKTTGEHYEDTTITFELASHPWGAEWMLWILMLGVKAEAERRARLERGELTSEDLDYEDV